ncbi:MAG: hypothetical protein GX596_05625 [Propionibacterium sp.]|nr:hypothetical protein [Propionibacterium sp.]
MGLRAEFRPDWPGWVWVRRALLLLMVAFMGWAGWGTYLQGEQFAGEPVWLAGLAALVVVVAWSRRPAIWSLLFVAVFATVPLISSVPYYGAAWFGAYAVCVDANSRRPTWAAVTVTCTLLLVEVFLNDASASDVVSSTVHLATLTLLGQFIRLAFAGSRMAALARDLESTLQRTRLHEAIHDSAGARLSQALVVARSLYRRPDLPDGVREDLRTMIEITSAGATELRAVINPSPDECSPSHPNSVQQAWLAAVQTLRSAGFDVADSAGTLPDLPPPLARETERVIREATANICTHASPQSRVAMAITTRVDSVELTWLNERPLNTPEHVPDQRGLGLTGMHQRVQALGGHVSITAEDDQFGLRVTLPINAVAHA